METAVINTQILTPIEIINGVEYGICPSKMWDEVPADNIEDAEVVEEMPTPQQAKSAHIDRAIYEELADKLKERAFGHLYISNECIPTDDEEHELKISAYVYYDKYSAPDYEGDKITDFVPMSCRLHSFDADGDDIANDFDFNELRKYI